MRLWPFSSSACEKVLNVLGSSGRGLPWLSSVTPLNSSDTKVNCTLSVPSMRRRIWKIAPPNVAWPDGYAGNGGVKLGLFVLLSGAPSGEKLASPIVAALPSPRPDGPVLTSDSRMPQVGRHVL